MSYCRWSSDDFGCDLYCYGGASGYITHVANNRVVGAVPPITASDMDAGADREFWKQYRAQTDFMETAERAPIGLPSDGESYSDNTLEEFLATLARLKGEGYHFPADLIDEVTKENEEPNR